jgi:hypothetical protein
VARQLALWGDGAEPSDQSRRRVARPIERDLEQVLADLASDFPLIAALVERHRGGQRRLPGAARASSTIEPRAPALAGELVAGVPPSPESPTAPSTGAEGGHSSTNGTSPPPVVAEPRGAGRGARSPGRYGLAIDFEHRADDPELARLVESTIWINDAHPAYRRAAASRSEGYHLALATALALAPLAVEPAGEHGFVTAFLAAWGGRIERGPRRRQRS